ncbi:MAG: hypothetical protein J5517_03875 [Eubacterium sp.]|nr:hypothetical protein [Eubacterium sp.]
MKKYVKSAVTAVLVLLALLIPVKTVNAEDVVAFTKPITLNSTFSETLTTETGVNAKYTFTLKKSGTLTVQIGFKEGSGYSWGYHGGVTLKDCDGKELANVGVRDNSGGTDSGVFTVDLLAGDYYLYVDTKANDNNPSNYIITTSYEDSNETVVDNLQNPHDSQANPIALPFGSVYTGHIALNSESDVYKVDIKGNVMLTVDLTNRTNGLKMEIINTNNTVKKDFSFAEKTDTEKVFCPAGTYYITISRRPRNYEDTYTYGTYTIKTTTSPLATTTIKKLKNKKGKLLDVKFGIKSMGDAAGYQIQYSTSKNFKKKKKTVTIENSDYLQSTYTLMGLKKKKTYYVRIRTYMTDNRGEQYFSAWSKAKKIKIKK